MGVGCSRRRTEWYYFEQKACCYLCAKRMALGPHGVYRIPREDEATWDHVEPRSKRSKGCRNARHNMLLAHWACNRVKADKPPLREHIAMAIEMNARYRAAFATNAPAHNEALRLAS